MSTFSSQRIAPPTARRVAVFFWEGYLGIAPSIINGIRILAEAGFEVDVFTRTHLGGFPSPPNFDPSLRIFYHGNGDSTRTGEMHQSNVHSSSSLVCRCRRWLPKVVVDGFRSIYHGLGLKLAKELCSFIWYAFRQTKRQPYICFFGVDTLGFLIAALLGTWFRTPRWFWSLELTFIHDFRDPISKVIRHCERGFHRAAEVTIIQDWERAQLLMASNRIKKAQVMIVPNGPRGPRHTGRSDFLHRRLNIPPERKIILHIGMIEEACLSMEVAAQAARWPGDWVLVCHSSTRRKATEEFLSEMRRISQERLVLSLEPVPYDELDQVVSSAFIGLVFYQRALGPNFVKIAGASGKLGHYLRCGLPVVSIDFKGLADLVRRFQCGICVPGPDLIEPAIAQILAHYEVYRANAFRAYEERFEFQRHFQPVVDRLLQSVPVATV